MLISSLPDTLLSVDFGLPVFFMLRPYVGQGAQQGLEDVAVAVALMKIHCLDDYGNLDLTNFEKAMKVYQEIRITRSSQILDFSKSLGEMQARRAGEDTLSRSNDNVLKGEVLMYGTLPVMRPGATHDYKDDIKRATEQHHLPEVTEEAAMEAVEYLLGGMASEAKSVSMPINSPLPVQKTEPLEKLVDPSARRDRQEELIAWTTSMLRHLIQKIVAHRNVLENKLGSSQSSHIDDHIGVYEEGKIVVDEVREVIEWPKNIRESNLKEEDPNEVELPQVVLDQLHSFVRSIAAFYRNNPFHNFEHACNVTLNVYKLLSRIASEKVNLTANQRSLGAITDPLTDFACVFAALIHDCDHEGVPNIQLAKEHPEMAQFYHSKALAEQNSVDVAWFLWMCPQYRELRETICANEEEMRMLRQLVVNIVIATDICDKDLKDFRNKRWEKHFSEESKDPDEYGNRLATIGIEHIIQASDVSHTMQPWQVYTKWNKCLYRELLKAYKEGRADRDPSELWYKGEIGFYNFYIIPLAKKLQQCQIFGSAINEFLNNAIHNRDEWIRLGEEGVKNLLAEAISEA